MQAVKRKSRLRPMIEPSLVERPQLGVRAVVLHVARHAVTRHVPMNALLLRDPLRYRLMADEAFRCGHLLARRVTLQTVADALERGVRARQAPRRHKCTKLGRRATRCHNAE